MGLKVRMGVQKKYNSATVAALVVVGLEAQVQESSSYIAVAAHDLHSVALVTWEPLIV